MQLIDLVNNITTLVPDAKFCVWNLSTGSYGGESNPIMLFGFAVDWSPTNTSPCPTEEQINSIPQ